MDTKTITNKQEYRCTDCSHRERTRYPLLFCGQCQEGIMRPIIQGDTIMSNRHAPDYINETNTTLDIESQQQDELDKASGPVLHFTTHKTNPPRIVEYANNLVAIALNATIIILLLSLTYRLSLWIVGYGL